MAVATGYKSNADTVETETDDDDEDGRIPAAPDRTLSWGLLLVFACPRAHDWGSGAPAPAPPSFCTRARIILVRSEEPPTSRIDCRAGHRVTNINSYDERARCCVVRACVRGCLYSNANGSEGARVMRVRCIRGMPTAIRYRRRRQRRVIQLSRDRLHASWCVHAPCAVMHADIACSAGFLGGGGAYRTRV